MTTKRNAPVRLAPDAGATTETTYRENTSRSNLSQHQLVNLLSDSTEQYQLQWVTRLSYGGMDISDGISPHMALLVLNRLWFSKRFPDCILTGITRYQKAKDPTRGDYYFGINEVEYRFGFISSVMSQVRFQRSIANATGVIIPHYEPTTWTNILRVVFKALEEREAAHV